MSHHEIGPCSAGYVSRSNSRHTDIETVQRAADRHKGLSASISDVDTSLASLPAWMPEPEAAWTAKLRRADEQRAALTKLVTDFLLGGPFALAPEPTEDPLMVAWRLRVFRLPPADISTLIGDMLHNFVGALDMLAYGLAERALDRELTPEEATAVEFPICRTPGDYETFFDGDTPAAKLRGAMYGVKERAAMWSVQTFATADLSVDESEERQQQRYRDDYEWSSMTRMVRLDTVARHGRLSIMLWWMDQLYYAIEKDHTVDFLPGDLSMQDNTMLCYFRGPAAHRIELRPEFALVMTDDPAHHPHEHPYQPQDCLAVLAIFAETVEQTIRQVVDAAWPNNPDGGPA